jgi:hypothetical protein
VLLSVNPDIRDKLPNGTIVFDNYAYDNSIIGVTLDGRVIYAYELMVKELMDETGWDEMSAMDWISYNAIGRSNHNDVKVPIIVSLFLEC